MSAVSASGPVASPPTRPPPPPDDRGPVRDVGTVQRESIRASAWTVEGLAKVQRDVEVAAADVRGLLTVGGRVAAGRFTIHGTFEAVGPVDVAETLTADGTVRLGATVRAGSLQAHGTFHGEGAARVDHGFSADGWVELPSLEATVVDLAGGAEIPGELVAAGAVRARFRSDSELGEIRARRVELHGPPTALVPTLIRKVFGGSAAVHVRRIEAESVELSAVDVAFVRAPRIVLGPGAHVTTVEGTIVRQHPSSRVGPESRTPPPYGLSR